ncbi:hypothetical protein C2G38_2189320 [Gigaspora rosea]|uniref:Uncharacterized protein n=1 Tax=Gigaspora rosea TaxID=44941 RepID=A0A397V2L5_9GLOM|nr:hypothetical protein C2G38_2189320 [Gigaspora rosea]
MKYIKEYTCHIEQRSSNLPITEHKLFNWLLKAKHECLPQELQNRAEGEKKIANANIINYEMAEALENKPKKTLKEMQALKQFHIAECYGLPSESLTENLSQIMTCTPIKDIDDRNNCKVDEVKACLNLPELIKYLQNLVLKMARVDSSQCAKKSGLKSDKAKLGLLNSVLSVTYRIKLKASNKKNNYYYLVEPFNSAHAPKLPPYQTDKGQFGKDIRYGYSKLLSDELETSSNSITQNT